MRSHYSIIASLIVVLLCANAFAQDRTDEVIRVDTALVNIPVIVSDRDNRYIPGLAQSNFKVFQDGTEQKVEVFNNEQAPMSIVLALDTSKSTRDVLGKIKKAAKEFIQSLDPDDRAMIVTFDYQVKFLSNLTSDKKELEKAVKQVRVGEIVGTVLNDAVFNAIKSTLKNTKGRKAIILLTDGKDHGSYYTRNDLFDTLNESDTVVYPIFYETGGLNRGFARQRFPGGGGMGRFPGGMRRGGLGRGGIGRFPGGNFPNGGNFPRGGGINRPNNERQNEAAIQFLQKLADITGGRFFKEKKADLKDAFLQIADEMKRQYLVGFYPPAGSPAGSVHKVKVQVDRPGAVVRSKSSYRTQSR